MLKNPFGCFLDVCLAHSGDTMPTWAMTQGAQRQEIFGVTGNVHFGAAGGRAGMLLPAPGGI